MISRRTFALSALAAVFAPMQALARSAFSQSSFDAAADAGKPVLIEFHADWCPTCRAQEKVINTLKGNAEYKGLVIFRIDFDAQKTLLERFRVRRQSTLIMFKNGREVGRTVGVTSSGGIKNLLNKAV